MTFSGRPMRDWLFFIGMEENEYFKVNQNDRYNINRSVRAGYIIKYKLIDRTQQFYNMLQRRLRTDVLIFILVLVPSIVASFEQPSENIQSQQCECLNGGTCSYNDKYISCVCPQGFIGSKCQMKATELSEVEKQATITQNYTYFYFQPKQINYYQISLKVCLPESQNKKITNLIFLEVERNSGKLKLQSSIYQTSPISFEGNEQRCQTFYTHFIPIRKKPNGEFQRVIFGIAIKNNSDPIANRWLDFLQKSTTDPQQSLRSNDMLNEQLNDISANQPQIQTQNIQISCTYELYLVENYWGTFIIIISAIALFLTIGIFLYTIRKKYSYTLSNDDILRLYAINPEQFAGSPHIKNDLTHFDTIMPIMSYELLVEKQKRAQSKYPKNMLKRIVQMHIQKEKISTPREGINQIIIPSMLCQQESSMSCSEIENVCSICLINFQTGQKVRQTPCRHIFHADCIDNWCQNTLNCPVCRYNLEVPRSAGKRNVNRRIVLN